MNMVFNCHLNDGDTFLVAGSELVLLHTKEFGNIGAFDIFQLIFVGQSKLFHFFTDGFLVIGL